MTKKKICILMITIAVLSLILSIWMKTDMQFLLSTIFTINGIMFSIGLGLISSFNLQGIKNKSYLRDIRSNIANVRNSFIWLFVLSSISFILTNIFKNLITVYSLNIEFTNIHIVEIDFNVSVCSLLLMSYSIAYFIYNFIEIQNLNNSIVDRLLEEE
ncbi:hypothetical protein [Wohlfahrtiimonas larvae]|uniref:DUF2975 domain-containing protein n=1 Tax=Wohlfahrtiimonas larvae TaxID=1157986 RepID=A0ABP9MV75_9GAMM|nr:hypothetical protein [Wohlfahrtiimonas larvae]